jgi:uncharacterized protein with ATP-grasp and redox domains
MTLDLLRKLPVNENQLRDLFNQVLELPALRGNQWATTSPQVIETIMRLMSDTVGNPDPFAEIKREQNQRVTAIYPELKQWVRQAVDPLETAVKLAIIGNAIDFMIAGGPSDLTTFIRDKLTAPISAADFSQLRQQLSESRSLVYFTDNCGEIVLDRLLIETLKSLYPNLEVSLVVKNLPSLNDATIKEARAVGIDTVATVIENGIDGPLPGTLLSRCSPRVLTLVRQADLIISKGGGNFDTLSEDLDTMDAPLFFLLLSKCVPFMNHFNARMHDLVLFNATSR